eukprot:477681-Alexandrium_andersonii.AAC.1
MGWKFLLLLQTTSAQSSNCRTSTIAAGIQSLHCAGPGTASNSPPCKASSAGFGVILRAESR